MIRLEPLRAVSLTYLSILKEGFVPIFSATLSYGRRAFHHKKTGITFPICLGKRSLHNFSHSVNMAATLNIILWKCTQESYFNTYRGVKDEQIKHQLCHSR